MEDKIPPIRHTRGVEIGFNLSLLKDLSLQPLVQK